MAGRLVGTGATWKHHGACEIMQKLGREYSENGNGIKAVSA